MLRQTAPTPAARAAVMMTQGCVFVQKAPSTGGLMLPLMPRRVSHVC